MWRCWNNLEICVIDARATFSASRQVTQLKRALPGQTCATTATKTLFLIMTIVRVLLFLEQYHFSNGAIVTTMVNNFHIDQ